MFVWYILDGANGSHVSGQVDPSLSLSCAWTRALVIAHMRKEELSLAPYSYRAIAKLIKVGF